MSYIPVNFGMSSGGNTSGTSGTVSNQVVFVGGNNITLSQSTTAGSATISISGGAGGAGLSAGISTGGNSAGTSGTVTNQLIFAGGNNVTLSQATGAGGNTITISAGAGGAGSNTLGMSNLGNTSGTTGAVSGSAVQFAFAGGNNVTLSQSLNGSSGTITISAAAAGAGSFTGGMSNIGNTSGTTGVVNNQLVLAGGNNVTLSQSVNGQSATVTISAGAGGGGGAQTLSRYQNMDRGTSATLAVPVRTLFFQRLNQENDLFAGNMTASTWLMNMSGTASSGASSTQTLAAHTTTVSIGIYQPVATANTVLTLINSATTTFGSNTTMSLYPHYFGNRWMSFHSSQWSSAPAFSQGEDYVFAVLVNTSGTSTAMSFIGQNYMNSQVRSGYWGVSTTSGNTSMPHGNYWNAIYSATTTALPNNISGGQVNRANATAIFIPHIIMNNQYTY